MKLNRKLNLLFALIALVFLFSAVTSGLFFYVQNQSLAERIRSDIDPTLAEIKKSEARTNLLLADIQADVVEVVSGMQLNLLREPDFQLFKKEFVIDRLRAANKAKDLNESRLRELGSSIDQLMEQRRITTDLIREAKDKKAMNAVFDSYQENVGKHIKSIRKALSALEGQKQAQLNEVEAAMEQNNVYALLMLGGGLLILLLMLLIGFLTIQNSYTGPMANVLGNMNSRKALAVNDSDVGTVAAYLNKVHQELREVEAAIVGFAAGAARPDVNEQNLSERMRHLVENLGKTMLSLKDDVMIAERERDKAKLALANAEAATVDLRNSLQTQIDRLEQGAVIAYTDAEFNIVRATPALLKSMGFSEADITGRKISLIDRTPEQSVLPKEIKEELAKGRQWLGEFRATQANGAELIFVAHVASLGAELMVKANNVTDLRKQIVKLDNTLQSAQTELRDFKRKVETAEREQSQLREQTTVIEADRSELQQVIELQKQLENRLVQQQAALQELTRNSDLKHGNVREAIRFITETAVFALDDERVGLWLYTDAGEKLRCLDRYDRKAEQHVNSLQLHKAESTELFTQLQEDKIYFSESAGDDPLLGSTKEGYLLPQGVTSLMAAPIRLGGSIVGHVLAEFTEGDRRWTLDEQNFLMSVADIVSLALEQGNRRAMEEELRVTLEEAQALEEELRQNAEEIEATNEEMRRTQIELRGQISALNNSAIVTESNLEGTITYVNNEFLNVYKYSKKEILGQNHRVLNSAFHASSLYQLMWSTIMSGKIWKGELRNQTREGEGVWVQITITPVLGLDSRPYKFISVSFNITSQKKQEEQVKQALDIALKQEELLREKTHAMELNNEEMKRTEIELAGQINALNNASLVYETDVDGKMTYVNDALLRAARYAREELLGAHYSVVLSGRQPEFLYEDQWNSLSSGRIWHGELEYKTRDNKFFWVLATSTPVLNDNDEPIKTINVLFEITEQKLQEFRLKKQQNALVELTGDPQLKDPDNEKAFELILRTGAETLGVEHAALWMFDLDEGMANCVREYTLTDKTFAAQRKVELSTYPNFYKIIERERIVVSDDTMTDTRLLELAYTHFKPEDIVSAMYVPIRSGPHSIGFIALEHKHIPRDWELDEQAFASSLADTTGLVLEQKQRVYAEKLREAFAALEEANRQVLSQKELMEESNQTVMDSIKYAKRIQKNILPSPEEMKIYLDNFFIVHKPRDIVGGDFHWFTAIDNKRVIVVADGTGHGVPGAFLTLIGYLLLNQTVNEKKILRPADILYHMHLGVRTALKQDTEDSTSRDGMDMAVFVFDADTLQAQYAGANLPLHLYTDMEIQEIKPDKKSIGGEQMEEERIFHNHEFQLKENDAVYLYTDGFVDQIGGPEEKRFSTRRFRDLILRTQHESMSTQRALLNLEWRDWKDDREQLDDVTVFGIKF
jgi:PAS domain S-box-containing protein